MISKDAEEIAGLEDHLLEAFIDILMANIEINDCSPLLIDNAQCFLKAPWLPIRNQ